MSIMRHALRRLFGKRPSQRDFASSRSPLEPTKTTNSQSIEQNRSRTRIDRVLSRTPKFLHKHVTALRSAPISHVTAFLLLHEITAIIPLFGLAGAFHYYHWLPPFFAEGAWVVAGVEKFGRYFRRKGWISDAEEQEAEHEVRAGDAREVEKHGVHSRSVDKWFGRSETSVRWVIEFATAYAVVKAFLIPRLILSAWGAPWFARWTVIPFLNLLRRNKASKAA